MHVNKNIIRKLRAEIDEIDADIIRMLARRFQAVQRIGYLKKKFNLQVEDNERENFLHKRLEELAIQHNLDFSFLDRLWKEILKESYRIQLKSRSHE